MTQTYAAPARGKALARKRAWLLAGALPLALACGDAEPITPPLEDTSLIPVKVGNRWTYEVTDASGIVSTKIQTVVGATTAADGREAFVFETSRAEERGTRSVQRVEDGRLLRISEATLEAGAVKARFSFEPFGLRIDSSQVAEGDVYTDTHDKHELDADGQIVATVTKAHTFVVQAVGEVIDVPAGTFETVRVLRQRDGSTDKTYWYAPGLGKVKEVGGQTEALVRAEQGD